MFCVGEYMVLLYPTFCFLSEALDAFLEEEDGLSVTDGTDQVDLAWFMVTLELA